MIKIRVLTYLEAIREGMQQAMRADETVYLLGEDIGIYGGAFGVTKGMVEEFGPKRVRDTPISELGMAGVAVGSALTGMRPILEYQFSDFITIGIDQIVNQAAKIRYMYGGKAHVPMVIRTPSGSGTGAAAQHSQSLEAWLTHIPGLKIVQPATAYDAKGLLQAAIADPNPVIFYEHKLLYKTVSHVPEEIYHIPLGKAVVKRPGSDVTVIPTGMMVPMAIKAADLLADRGIQVEVIDPRTLVPLDKETILHSVRKTGRVVIVHEAVKRGGYGGEIASIIAEEAFHSLRAPIKRLGGVAAPIPFNKELEAKAIPQQQDLIQTVEEIML